MKSNLNSYYIALGSFDGLHRGHLELIDKCIELAKANDDKSMVYTFTNHPRETIFGSCKINYLINNEKKEEVLLKRGIDRLVLKEFNSDFMKKSPEEFIKGLLDEFNVKGFVVGFNYKFGYMNLGDIKLLKELSIKYKFELNIISPMLYENEVVSSTRIRECLLNGNIKDANTMLTRPYEVIGTVVKGKQLGRTIGFPTANLELSHRYIIPKIGVYYTNVVYNGEKFKGITSVGTNPTVNGKKVTIETYILDFSKDIYGKELKLIFLDRIRDEKKFNSLDELKLRLNEDKKIAMSK